MLSIYRMNIIKNVLLPTMIYRLNAIPMPMFSTKLKEFLKIIWNQKRLRISILSKSKNKKVITRPYFKFYCRANNDKNSTSAAQKRMCELQKTEDIETNPWFWHKGTYIGVKIVSNKWCWEYWLSTGGRLHLDLCISSVLKSIKMDQTPRY